MSWNDFWLIFAICALTMIACRVLPLLLLKGRELPESVTKALGLIPPAAFAALVTNDLFNPSMFANGIWPAGAVLIAAICVIITSVKTRSLVISAIVGVSVYAILLVLPI